MPNGKDHSEQNLAVLCLRHHGEAHTKRELGRNLDKKMIISLKKKWESEVSSLDTRAILSLADANRESVRFDYINHFRIFERARAKKMDLTTNPHYQLALRRGLIREWIIAASLNSAKRRMSQRYDFGDGMYLYPYVFDVVKDTLRDTPIFNISDYLDRGELVKLLRTGDIICLQGAHTFKRTNKRRDDPLGDATSIVRRKVKDIEITFNRYVGRYVKFSESYSPLKTSVVHVFGYGSNHRQLRIQVDHNLFSNSCRLRNLRT